MERKNIDLRFCGEKMTGLASAIGNELINIEDTIKMAVLTIFASPDGRYSHFLLEAPPGMGKTVLCKTIAGWCNLRFTRIQLTPDMQPGEIVMTHELDMKGDQVKTKMVFGPIFTNILLADEINRTPPRTQSSILQPMAECETTYGGRTYNLGHDMTFPGEDLKGERLNDRLKEMYDEETGMWRSPPEAPLFYVFATQNPVENEGTYRLPEAQLDRFLFKMELDYPTEMTIQTIVKNKSIIRTYCRAWLLEKGKENPVVEAIMKAPAILKTHTETEKREILAANIPLLKNSFYAGVRSQLIALFSLDLGSAEQEGGADYKLVMTEIEGLILEKRFDYKKAQPKAAMDPQDVIAMRYRIALSVGADPLVCSYISAILERIQVSDDFGLKVSPRCLDTIISVSKAHCVFRVYQEYQSKGAVGQFPENMYITKEDINACAINMLPHRVSLSYEAQAKGYTARQLIAQILRSVKNDPCFTRMD